MSPENTPPEISAQELDQLAIFPLPGAVLFPHSLLPLHIFEPRYRALTRHLIETGAPLGIASLLPGYEERYHQSPTVHTVLGVGRLVHHEPLPDGRFNIILRGQCRARLVEELTSPHPWRLIRAQAISEVASPPERTRALLDTLRGCLFGLGQQHGRLAALIAKRLNTIQEPGPLADSLLSALLPDQEQRLEALADPDIASRLDRINACVSELLLQGPLPQGGYSN